MGDEKTKSAIRIDESEARKLFRAMHHPDSPLRQLADWKNGDPKDPPPAVRKTIEQMRDIELPPITNDEGD